MKAYSLTDNIIRLISNKKIQLLLIVVIAVAFYANSINDRFAYDDQQVYTHNQFVQKGVAGIPDLFTKESMYGFYSHPSNIGGGLWRPLSLITFALEKQYFDGDPHISHTINLLLLLFTGVIMLLFLRQYVFKSSPIAAFIVVLLFIIHPVHTEAVTHLKSRDELMSWLFLLLTMYCSLNFLTKKNYGQLLLAFVFYFLALLSKENGITFIVLLPLTFYFFTAAKRRTIALTTLLFVVVFAGYALMRFSFVPLKIRAATDLLFNPYFYATPAQHFATALMLLGKYILLLFWPNPLICDYSYNTIPYVNFSDWRVWLSIIIQAALVLYALLKLKDKNLVSYGILFYFCSIFIVSNLISNLAPIFIFGERFLYQPSFGFCIAIVVAANEILAKIKFKNTTQKLSILSLFIAIIVLLSGFQTIRRNADWEYNMILFNADVKKAPNSVLIRHSLGDVFMDLGDNCGIPPLQDYFYHRAIGELDTAIMIYPNFSLTRISLGNLYFKMGNLDSTKSAFLKCIQIDSTYSGSYGGVGTVYYNEKNYPLALTYFKKGAKLDTVNAELYFSLGLCYAHLGDNENALQNYKKTLSLLLNHPNQMNKEINPQILEQDIFNVQLSLQNKNQ